VFIGRPTDDAQKAIALLKSIRQNLVDELRRTAR
jgi:hypothetical protein